MKKLDDYVRSIPDFPEPGIIFRDVTSILQDANGLHLAIDKLLESLEGVEYDVVVGLMRRIRVLSQSVKRASCLAKQFLQNMTWNMGAQ